MLGNRNPIRYSPLTDLGTIKIIFTISATQNGENRLFPASKNRSARIRKKLIKRFGGEFEQVPAIYRAGNTIYVHPSFRAQIEAQTKRAFQDTYENQWSMTMFGQNNV